MSVSRKGFWFVCLLQPTRYKIMEFEIGRGRHSLLLLFLFQCFSLSSSIVARFLCLVSFPLKCLFLPPCFLCYHPNIHDLLFGLLHLSSLGLSDSTPTFSPLTTAILLHLLIPSHYLPESV